MKKFFKTVLVGKIALKHGFKIGLQITASRCETGNEESICNLSLW